MDLEIQNWFKIELLLTRPLTDAQIILGKYLAAFTLVVFSLIPTLIYFYSVSQLGNPVGNLDVPGITGSYLGLVLLGGVFTAIGFYSELYSRIRRQILQEPARANRTKTPAVRVGDAAKRSANACGNVDALRRELRRHPAHVEIGER